MPSSLYNIIGGNMKSVIKDLDTFGRGITKINDKVCFVEKALPSEEVEIEIINEKKNYIEAETSNIIKESDYRILPICPYYDKCGGCHLMHLDRKGELLYKEEKVTDALSKFAGLKDVNIKDIIYANEHYYRNKLTLHIKDNKLGLYTKNTNDLIEIDECVITNQTINEIIPRLKDYLETNKSNLNEIVIKTTSSNYMMIIFKGETNINSLKDSFNDIDSVYLNDKLVIGKEYIEENLNDLVFYIYPDSFFQVNYYTQKLMYNKVIDYYKEHKDLNILDLYCGTGTIGMLVSKYTKSVIGVEINSDAIKSANLCKEVNNISNIEFILGSVEDNIDKFDNIDSIIVDPPRSGLDKHTVSSIMKINPSSIIYISCDIVTLARDLNTLKENYNIKEVTPIDMFPNTYHVETLCILERK